MSVPQYTTPTLTFTFTDENLDLTLASDVIVTLEAKTRRQIEKSGSDLTILPKKITLELTQQETAMLAVGEVKAMINWVFPNGKRAASKIKMIEIGDNLHRKVM